MPAVKTTEADIRNIYSHASGTVEWHKHIFGKLFTDGVLAVAEKAGAFWLIDVVMSYRRPEHFQVWTLTVTGSKCVVEMKLDSKTDKVQVRQRIGYTDFPEGVYEFWMVDGVLMLPSEY
jgi:hypothetical protein